LLLFSVRAVTFYCRTDSVLGVDVFVDRAIRDSSRFCRIASHLALSLLTAGLLAGCGGGSSNTAGPPPPAGNFSLSLSSSALSIAGATSGSVSVSVVGSNGFSGGVAFTISGLPSDITASPATFSLNPGQSQQITFAAPPYVSASTSSITIDGNSGPGYDHSTTLSLQVSPYQGNISLPRTRYVRTDAVEPNTVIFDSNTNRFFMADPGSNRLMVIDAATRTEVGTITVPGAYDMDETPDHKTLYVGTEVGDVYAVDPVGMTVTHRYIASQIGPNGFQAASVRVLANGNLALVDEDIANSTDGFGGFAIWDPTNNSIALYEGGNTNSVGPCTNHDSGFTLTADRNTVILSQGNTICTVNSVTGQVNSAAIVAYPIVATPDGKSLLALQYGIQAQILVLNPQTLAQVRSFPVIGPSGSYVVVSPDSGTVYIAPQSGGVAYAYNIASGNEAGWLPDINISGVGVIGTWISAADNTGLLAGVTVEGMGILDGSALRTGSVGTALLNGYLDPTTGPLTGGTQVSGSFPANVDAVYFGATLATSISAVSGSLEATTPPGSPGPVDVYALFDDGGMQVIPYAYSYGPNVLAEAALMSTADGGGTATVFGFGFGNFTGSNNASSTSLQVEVGGQAAQITTYKPNAYGGGSPPVPIQSIAFAVPPGPSGSSGDITVSSQSGTTTLSGGMRYLPATQQIPVTGASLAQGIYDSTRDLYYFTDTAEIRVYSKSQNQWLTSVQVPAAPSGLTHQLWGIALSPDGSKLALSDAGAGMVYLINPDSTGSVQSFNLNSLEVQNSPVNPAGLAISDAGMIYTTTASGEVKINANTGTITSYGVSGTNNALLSRVVISSDNSRVFFSDGRIFSIDTATDAIEYPFANCCFGDSDLSLSSSQTTIEGAGYSFDLNLDPQSYLTTTDEESLNTSYVYGEKLSPDGTLLFQPSTNGIDVYDGRLGTLLDRVALPFALSQNFDALVSDGKDNVLIAITGTTGSGIAVVDLSSISEPSPLPYQVAASSSPVGRNFTANPNINVPRTSRNALAIPRTSIMHATNGIVPSKSMHN
jgi:hypothetical protein